jgi:hypothetical protein
VRHRGVLCIDVGTLDEQLFDQAELAVQRRKVEDGFPLLRLKKGKPESW